VRLLIIAKEDFKYAMEEKGVYCVNAKIIAITENNKVSVIVYFVSQGQTHSATDWILQLVNL
jgi:hypothetical protein